VSSYPAVILIVLIIIIIIIVLFCRSAMKSMSWLLYENDNSVRRECQACGFSTYSPSIYRRHSRHCVISNSTAQQNSTVPVSAYPDVMSTASVSSPDANSQPEFSDDRLKSAAEPAGDFPSVSNQGSMVDEVGPETGNSEHVDNYQDVLLNDEEMRGCGSVDTGRRSVPNTEKPEELKSTDEPSHKAVSQLPCAPSCNCDMASDVNVSEGCLSANDEVLQCGSESAVTASCDPQPISDSSITNEKEVNDGIDDGGQTLKNRVFDGESVSEQTAATSGGCVASQQFPTVLKKSRSKSSSPNKQLRCKHCKVVFTNGHDRRIHIQTKHPEMIPVFRCMDCDYRSVEHKNFERHLLRHLLDGPFHCPKCSFSSTSQSSVRRHVAFQHTDQSDAPTPRNSAASETSPKVAKIPPTTSDGLSASESPVASAEKSGTSPVDSVSRSFDPVSELRDPVSGADLVPTANNHCGCHSADSDCAVSSTACSSGADLLESENPKMENPEIKLGAGDTPDSSGDMIQQAAAVEVEVKCCPSEVGGQDETWWTCMSCGARYNQRAKVRRHVKCKHHIPLTSCSIRDLRAAPASSLKKTSTSLAEDLLKKLKEVRSACATQATDIASQSSSLALEQISVKRPAPGGSVVASRLKSFVKIAPKPIQLDAGSPQMATAAASIVNSRRQVVLPKRDWKRVSIPLQVANQTSSTASETDVGPAAATCGSESELKRHLTSNVTSATDELQKVTKIELPELDAGSTEETPKKKQRLILQESDSSVLLDQPCSIAVTETGKENDASATSCDAEALSHDLGESSKEMAGDESKKVWSTSEPVSTSVLKRHFGVKQTSPLKCAHCQFTSFRLADLRRHLLQHTGDTVFECVKCCRSFRNRIGLYLHRQRKHKDEDFSTGMSTSDDIRQMCVDGGNVSGETQTGENSSDGVTVKRKVDESETPEVSEPGKNEEAREKRSRKGRKSCTEEDTVEVVQSADNSDHFKIVIRRRSSIGEELVETIAGVNNGMMCRFCGYTAKIPAQLTQHLKIHTGERDYWCCVGDCAYGTIWRCDMKRHLRKFHSDDVERHGGSCYDLLQRCYRPSKPPPSSGPTEPSSAVGVQIKMSKRQRRRLLKLQSEERSRLSTKDAGVVSEFAEGGLDSPAVPDGEHSTLEGKKDELVATKPVERFRPYKCSECGRRSNWRWDLKKHIQTMHNGAAAIIKLNSDVARSTFAELRSLHGGRNGIRFPRLREPTADSPSNPDADDGQSTSELERALTSAPRVKSIGMIDMLRLKRFQCSSCPYRSNHRGDLGRHIRMRHGGRGNCGISVLAADVAAATLHAYRLQWNRKKAWLPRTDPLQPKTQKFAGGSGSPDTEDKVAEEAKQVPAVGELGQHDVGHGKQQHWKEQACWWYVDGADDETKCCDLCPFRTDRTGLLELHKLRHRAPAATSSIAMTFSCPHCPYFVRTARQLERHMALHEDTSSHPHRKPLLDSAAAGHHMSRGGSSKNSYVCEKCPFVTMLRNEFWLHRRHHFVPKVDAGACYCCDLCSFWASERRAMSEHATLYTQSYYPRLSVPVVSRYSRSRAVAGDKVTCEVTPEVGGQVVSADGSLEVEEAGDQLATTSSNDAEVLECPILEPQCTVVPDVVADDNHCGDVGVELISAVREVEGGLQQEAVDGPINDMLPCCPTLEPECVLSAAEAAVLPESIGASLNAEACLSSTQGAVVAAEVLAKQSKHAARDDAVSEADSNVNSTPDAVSTDWSLSTESAVAVLPFPADAASVNTSESAIASAEVNDAVTSVYVTLPVLPVHEAESSGVIVSHREPGYSYGGTSAADATDAECDDFTVCQSPSNCCQSFDAEPRILSQSESAASGSSPDAEIPTLSPVPSDLGDAIDSGDAPDVSPLSVEPVTTEVPHDHTLSASAFLAQPVGAKAGCEENRKCDPLVGELGDEKTGVSVEGNCGDPVASENDKLVVESRDSGVCTCGLQCPYCFYSIASVRLLRQHIVFHVAMSDAIRIPVFDPHVDSVEDGRMDDVRCADLVRLCRQCRHFAVADVELESPMICVATAHADIPSTSSQIASADVVTAQELENKMAFMTELSLKASHTHPHCTSPV